MGGILSVLCRGGDVWYFVSRGGNVGYFVSLT